VRSKWRLKYKKYDFEIDAHIDSNKLQKERERGGEE
jgi:hypothetical protein